MNLNRPLQAQDQFQNEIQRYSQLRPANAGRYKVNCNRDYGVSSRRNNSQRFAIYRSSSRHRSDVALRIRSSPFALRAPSVAGGFWRVGGAAQ
jgi:hypothetical protein